MFNIIFEFFRNFFFTGIHFVKLGEKSGKIGIFAVHSTYP